MIQPLENAPSLSSPGFSRRAFLAGGLAAAGLLALEGCSTQAAPNVHNTVAPDPRHTIDFFGDLPDGPLKEGGYWHYITDPQVADYNDENQIYTPDHATIHNGQLTLDAVQIPPTSDKATSDGHEVAKSYEASRIESQGAFNFTHGTLTATAMLPEGVGTWPAVWLLPEAQATSRILQGHGIKRDQAKDPFDYAWGGEIDFLETVGALPSASNVPALHTHQGLTAAKGGNDDPSAPEFSIPDGQKAFHEYTIYKEPGLLQFKVDGKVIREVHRRQKDTVNEWPFDDYKYFIIANLAMGGSWGGINKSAEMPLGVDDTKGPWEFVVKRLIYQPLK